MDYQIAAAPKVRDGRKPGKRPLIVLRARAEERGTGRFLLTLLAVVAAGVALAWFLWSEPGENAHLGTAKRLIASYERGRGPEQRNYNHSVYQQALEELSRVDPDSSAGAEAGHMAAALRAEIDGFNARLKREEARRTVAVKARQSKVEAMWFAREREEANPKTSFPECKEENIRHSHDHDH